MADITSGQRVLNQIAVSWTEPENPGEVNRFLQGLAAQAFLRATLLLAVRRSQMALLFKLGTDILNGGTISVTFFDNGDTARTPDTGTTLSLFGLSLMGLAFLRRLRHPNLGH